MKPATCQLGGLVPDGKTLCTFISSYSFPLLHLIAGVRGLTVGPWLLGVLVDSVLAALAASSYAFRPCR